jgi:hypothetical protein
MSKSYPKIDRQMSIFEILKEISTPIQPTREGQFRCVDRLQGAMRMAIKNCPLSIYQIAGEMSHLLGATITSDQIYSWTRESDELNGRPVRHIPFEYIPAFLKATGSIEPLRAAAELVGFFVFEGPEAMRAELQHLDDKIRELQGEKRKRQVFLKEMEKGR